MSEKQQSMRSGLCWRSCGRNPSRGMKWFTLSNAAERASRMNREQTITGIVPRSYGRGAGGAVLVK
jgi:hypothetical protein